MFVCHCRAVTDRAIRSEVEQGAATPHDVTLRCGAGGDCGRCVDTITALLADLLGPAHTAMPDVRRVA